MRKISAASLQALRGSRKSDHLKVYAWYDGDSTWDGPLPINDWSFSWDVDRQVQTLNLTIEDSTGELAPWLLEDPLGVGGARLQCIYHIGGAGTVNMGWYRVTTSAPDETWRGYLIDNLGQINSNSLIPKDKSQVFATGGATIAIQAADLAVQIKNNRLLGPESPKTSTVVAEIKRLLSGMVPVKVLSGVTDKAVSSKLVYEQERLDAVEDLCNNLGAGFRMNGDGQFEVYPLSNQTPVWTVQGGPEGALVRVNRDQQLEGLYNIFVAEGTTPDSAPRPLRGIASITSGPLRVNGPHGRYPTFYSSPLLTTQAQVNAYALVMRDTQLRGLTTDLTVRCLPHPALQQGDWVTVCSPVVNKQIVSLNGRVKKMDLRSAGSTVDAMEIVVECSYEDVQIAMATVARNEN